MGGTTLSRYVPSKMVKNYLEKEGYTLMTGWKILTSIFYYNSEKIKDEDLENISRIRFAFKGEKEKEEITQLFSALIESNKQSHEISKYPRTYGTITLYFIKLDGVSLESYRDISVFKKLMYNVINKELNKI